MEDYNLLIKAMPVFSVFFIIIVMSSVGLPGTSGFIGELLVVLGVYKYFSIYAFLVAVGLILGAIYMLVLVRKIIFTTDANMLVTNIKELSKSEVFIIVFLSFCTLVLGLFPNLLLNFIDIHSDLLLTNFKGKI